MINKTTQNIPAIINEDYETFFHQELLKYLHSPEWNSAETNFKRELQLQITPGDLEMLKKYLREQKDNCLNRFSKSGISWFWNKSFVVEKNCFDEILFIKKLYSASDGMIDSKDLNEFFSYFCMNRMIETILCGILEFEEKKHRGTFKVFINYGEVIFGDSGTATNVNDDTDEETILKNLIFNSKVFDTNDRLLQLRKVIAHSIDMGEYNALFGEPNASTINPAVQGEWYYVMKALEESEVANKKFSVPDFIDQMIDWYPWLFSFDTLEDMRTFKRKMEKSISHEKSIWRHGKAREVTRLKDMWARFSQTNIDYAKVERMFNAAYSGLCVKLVALKQEISKEKAVH